MSCEKCGAQVAGDDVFCPECGAKVATRVTPTATPPVPPPSSAPEAPRLSEPPQAAPPPVTAVAPRKPSEYQVVPFNASLMAGETTGKAAQQLSELINAQARAGWQYVRMETIRTTVTTPGSSGCFGIGSTPTVVTPTEVYVVVFSR
jgi:hypothetical protein